MCVHISHLHLPPAWPWQNCTTAAPLQPPVQTRPLKLCLVIKWWRADKSLSAGLLFFILPCSATVYPAQLSIPQAQLSLMPPACLGCWAALLHPACRWGLKTAFWRHRWSEYCSSLPEGNYSSAASRALLPPETSIPWRGEAVLKEQQPFPFSCLPWSSAEEQKEPEDLWWIQSIRGDCCKKWAEICGLHTHM